MNALAYFGVFGGGYLVGFVLLFAATFASRRSTKSLYVTALIIVGLQSLFWMWAANFASIADHGDHHTPVSLWVATATAAFLVAAVWSWLLFRFRHDHAP